MRLDEHKKITSVFIHGKEWWDKHNGNSYWAANIYINGYFVLSIPAGSGSSRWDRDALYTLMDELGYKRITGSGCNYHESADWETRNGIAVYSSLREGCKKKDVWAWGKCEPDPTYLEHFRRVASRTPVK